ncbi:MAG: riboflavin synthase [Desulfobulbaceae bacterium]|nr:MAG: riboflavin synthase [Desulfobulbaceae bacterium]
MFTGIIQGRGKVVGLRSVRGGRAFDFEAGFTIDHPTEGESIAVNGACLTAYNVSERRFSADVSPESLSRTTLGNLGVGSTINLERALQLSDRLGGHIVSGHVDCVGTLAALREEGDFIILDFSMPPENDRYIVEKGSITVDGISLTVNSCSKGHFSVSIIPHTWQMTTLVELKVGGKVNLEVDIIGKYVEKLLAENKGADEKDDIINRGYLAEKGFY